MEKNIIYIKEKPEKHNNIGEYFQKTEHSFLETSNDCQALNLMKYYKYDIVFIDETLEIFNGHFLAEIIKGRAKEENNSMKIIIIDKNTSEIIYDEFMIIPENVDDETLGKIVEEL